MDPFIKSLLSLSSRLAFEFVSAITIGILLGHLIDLIANSHPFALIIGGVFGIIAAGLSVFRFMRPFFKEFYKFKK